ncbi:hypothetical protein G166_gp18 [Clostridium phage phi8074-B1]|uniref:hypothetical protein n=1 Tax=Clostridium phage phi8074-B1 TaxID=1147137 RepID=UPI00025C0C45|nr:hypothetical protein G166_gp18 [Clostridium phage phi8074-B1]AFC61950.1 hypothetical protein phi8074-B1_00018 [Clostridium phage phi8074-B1]
MGVVINHSVIQEIKEDLVKDQHLEGTTIQLSQEKLKNIQLQFLVKAMGEDITKLKLEIINGRK